MSEDPIDIARRFIEALPHSRALGMQLVSFGNGRVEMTMPYDARFVGDPATGVRNALAAPLNFPPLIAATLAVIASFLPLFFITGMMGPYMRPMALNVPVTMVMSMVVAFTITPWLAFHLLKRRNWAASGASMPCHSR